MNDRRLQAKLVVLGAFSVGKTSLVSRFVRGIFSERYLATVGVKIDRASVALAEGTVELVVWDLQGEDEAMPLRMSHLRGAAACLLVADGTRPQTVEVAFELHKRARGALGEIPALLLLNKTDLVRSWAVEPEVDERARRRGLALRRTSAKTGEGVEACFQEIARRLLGGG